MVDHPAEIAARLRKAAAELSAALVDAKEAGMEVEAFYFNGERSYGDMGSSKPQFHIQSITQTRSFT